MSDYIPLIYNQGAQLTAPSLIANVIQNNNMINQQEEARSVWGEYNNTTPYTVQNKVFYNGSSYRCKVSCAGILPTNSTYWQIIASAGGDITDASQLAIIDTGNYYPFDDVNSALQEAGRRIGDLTQLETTLNTDLVSAINDNTQDVSANTSSINALSNFNINNYGLVGDGTIDDSTALTNLFNAITSNSRVVFDKKKVYRNDLTNAIVINNKSYITIDGLHLNGTSAGGINIANGSHHITFKDCFFEDIGQVVYLFTCDHITIDNCTFRNTGYCIIQQSGHISNHVKVINCFADNVKNDFVECNCESTAPSKDWNISNNQYTGCYYYPTVKTESRFFGGTYISNVIISGNIIENCSGDSAIHLEDLGEGININNNNIKDCRGTGYVYISDIGHSAIISDNTFTCSESDNLTPFIYHYTGSTLANSEDCSLQVTGNKFYSHNLHEKVLAFNYSRSKRIVSANQFNGMKSVINLENVENIIFSTNIFKCVNGILYETTNAFCNDISISDNFFECSNKAIYLLYGSNGTSFPTNIVISGNIVTGILQLNGCKTLQCVNNIIDTEANFIFEPTAAYSANMLASGNMIKSGGLSTKNNNVKSAITRVPDYVGQLAVVGANVYVAKGVSATSDWKLVTTAA